MAQTFIVKGAVITNPSANDIGRAQFVRITATGDVTGTIVDSADAAIGSFYLEDGNTIIIEKAPGDKISCGTSKASAVGSPRS